MDRKDFLRLGILGTGVFVTGAAGRAALSNDIDELKPLEPMGFNHLPLAETPRTHQSVIHRADTRGRAQHGWLDSHHTFSFANYYHPERMHFGVLRVLNDDWVQAGRGFGTHPHDNMEIVSIPLEGDLEHRDSMGNVAVIRAGDIQVMSAGTGITHSEMNRRQDAPVKFLQIWLFPNRKQVEPRYGQIALNPADRHNRLAQILSPSPDDAGVWVHQDAWFHLGRFDAGASAEYAVRKPGNGVYCFVLSGRFEVAGTELGPRDGMGLWDLDAFNFTAVDADSEILLMDVPMAI
jgi:hypothetical protein